MKKIEDIAEKRDNQAAYCKCGRIIFMSSGRNFRDMEPYWDAGYKVGLATNKECKELYGCQCAIDATINNNQ